jgi:hypothetical protein
MMTMFAKVSLIMTTKEGYDDAVCQSELDYERRRRP